MKHLLLFSLFNFASLICLAQCEENEIELRVEITTDEFAGETYWNVKDLNDNVLLAGGQGGTYEINSTYVESICVSDNGCYIFEIWDIFGDGIFSPGGFEFYLDEVLVMSGGEEFGAYSQEVVYCEIECPEAQIELRLELATDQYAGETYWTLTDLFDNVILEGGQEGSYTNNTVYLESICLPDDGCYIFEIWDTYGDGIYAPNGYEFYVDDVLVASGADDIGSYVEHIVYCPTACMMVETALLELHDHILDLNALSDQELLEIRDIFFQFPECLAETEEIILLGKTVVEDYDNAQGALFTTPQTEYGFSKDAENNPGLELEHAMVALEQGIFDEVFKPEVYEEFPQHLHQWKFNSCINFPGDVDPPADSTLSVTALIRANFEDPEGMNPYFDISQNSLGQALRPTGLYLAPGSFATVTVPEQLLGQDFYVRVGSHDWDLSNRPFYGRLDRISKLFPINSTTVDVFNPLGGAISILVPYGADAGNVEISVNNGVEAPFISIKSFDLTTDVEAELEKPAPWAVFESENVMYTIPSHSIIPGQYDLMQTLTDWEMALRGMNSILAREIMPDKHNMYMIADVDIRFGAYSIGYPMSNTPLSFIDEPGPAYFINGPGPDDETNFHETGHALAMSKFDGEEEAIVNFPYIMAMNYGLGEDLIEAVKYSFVPNTFDIDKTATHRMMSNSFGFQRDISNTTTDEVRYQHRGYGHYFEIVNLLGWCPLRNFWRQEYIDFQNGIDHGINDQNIDSRIVRLCVAAKADLRPLFHVFGILPQNESLQNALDAEGIQASLIVYNRLQEYFDLIPEDNAAFVEYALSVYPNLYTDGPNEDPNYGVGWHYLKSLSYNSAEAQLRTALLQDIVGLYYPNGAPDGSEAQDVCCTLDPMVISLDNEEVIVNGGTAPYSISIETEANVQTVTVTDFDNCVASENFIISDVQEQDEIGFGIFPNPTQGIIQLRFETNETRNVEVFDAKGRQVMLATLQSASTTLNLSSLPEGIYIIRSGAHQKRVVVMKGW